MSWSLPNNRICIKFAEPIAFDRIMCIPKKSKGETKLMKEICSSEY